MTTENTLLKVLINDLDIVKDLRHINQKLQYKYAKLKKKT